MQLVNLIVPALKGQLNSLETREKLGIVSLIHDLTGALLTGDRELAEKLCTQMGLAPNVQGLIMDHLLNTPETGILWTDLLDHADKNQ